MRPSADASTAETERAVSGPSVADVLESGREVADEGRRLWRALGRTAAKAEAWLQGELDRRPLTVLGTAAGAGYVLGAKVPAGVTMWLFSLGGRVLVTAFAREIVGGGVGSQVPRGLPPSDPR